MDVHPSSTLNGLLEYFHSEYPKQMLIVKKMLVQLQ